MDKGNKRRVILVDEMKLSEGVYFDHQSMKFNDFVDLEDTILRKILKMKQRIMRYFYGNETSTLHKTDM